MCIKPIKIKINEMDDILNIRNRKVYKISCQDTKINWYYIHLSKFVVLVCNV